jgi:hypothetical protein
MAFLKRCVSTVIKCACGKPGVSNLIGSWYCADCLKKEKDSKNSCNTKK